MKNKSGAALVYHWQSFPLLSVLLSLVAGKLFRDQMGTIPDWGIFGILGTILLSGIFFLLRNVHSVRTRNIRTFHLCALWFCVGLLFPGPEPKSDYAKASAFIFKTEESIGENAKSDRMRMVASLEAVRIGEKWQDARGGILITIKGNGHRPVYGARFLAGVPLRETEPAAIPGQFDAKNYYRRKGIFYQVYLSDYQIQRLYPNRTNPFLEWACSLRQFLVNKIETSVYEAKDADVLIALLLGIRRKIDPELKAAHSAAGTSHILAVSGMHVGLIFGFLRLLFSWLLRIKGGKTAFSVCVISLLWLYALITGLSPSVNRAVMVFSVLQLGDLIQKPKFPLNSLFLATLILFFLDPEIVYDVGYQLSFAAVYGILSFQKPISGFWNPRERWKRKIRDDISLTLAATLATCPIILFYFHQFPVYFLAANLLAVPLSNFLIYMGIGLISLSWIPVVKTLAGLLVHGTILLLNGFILGISRLPFSVIENLFIPLWALIPLFGFLIFFQLFLHRFQHKWLVFSLFGLLLYSGSVFGYQTWLRNRKEKSYVIRTGEEWMLASVSGQRAKLILLGSDTLKTPNSFEAKALREGFHVQQIAFEKIAGFRVSASAKDSSKQSRLLTAGEKTILILGNYLKIRNIPKQQVDIDVLIARNAGFKTLENALLLFRPKEIWGNYSEKTMQELRIKFPQYQWINFKSKRFTTLECKTTRPATASSVFGSY